jgi:hypothetical protein
MAKKTWAAYAETRKALPGVWELVTRPTPDTALNPERLAYLKSEAEKAGLLAEIRPLNPGKRPLGLYVSYPKEK